MFRRGLVGLRRCHDWLRSWIDALHLEIDWLPILWSGIALAFCLFVLVPTDRYYNEYAEHPKEAAQNKASNGADDDRIADYTWWVAVFTGVLGISTIGLWFVTWQSVRHAKADSVRQARQLRVSNIAAIRAATAGEKTIERMDKTAAHQLRAYVFVHRTALELTKKAQSAGTIGGYGEPERVFLGKGVPTAFLVPFVGMWIARRVRRTAAKRSRDYDAGFKAGAASARPTAEFDKTG
jgi:hypothetical protein